MNVHAARKNQDMDSGRRFPEDGFRRNSTISNVLFSDGLRETKTGAFERAQIASKLKTI